MNFFDRWILRRSDKLIAAIPRPRPPPATTADIFGIKESGEPGTFNNEQSRNNTFTLHKCVDGHLLEVWLDESNSVNTPKGGSGRTQKMYIIPEGDDVISIVAQALVSDRLESK